LASIYSIYNELGHGFLESIYQQAFAVVLVERGVALGEQLPIRVVFHGVDIGEFKADLVAERSMLIELKAMRALENAHERQVLNYVKATNLDVGLTLQFWPATQVRRLVMDNELKLAKSARKWFERINPSRNPCRSVCIPGIRVRLLHLVLLNPGCPTR